MEEYEPAWRQKPQRSENTKSAKKRVRSIQRRLNFPVALPANVQQDLERELEALTGQIQGWRDKKQRTHMISKYHMLRFFGATLC